MSGARRSAKLAFLWKLAGFFARFPGQILGLGTRLTPCVCAAMLHAMRHFEVERKCELIERLDLVHVATLLSMI